LSFEEKNQILLNSFLSDKEENDRKYDMNNKKLNKRDNIQNDYVTESIIELNKNKRVLIKAPTGFGKTHIIYKLISKLNLNNILILTPRLLLNKQIIENKYTKYINNYEIKELTGTIKDKEEIIKNLSNKFILTSCYQSYENVSQLIIKYNLKINIIFDEAHFISSWSDINNLYLENNKYVDNRIFLTATPIDNMIINDHIFGKCIEKIKIFELIDEQILCNIVTITKKIDNQKKEYHDLSKMIIDCMLKYNKIKGIIYVNNCANAENLFKILIGYNKINTYIYISKKIDWIDNKLTLLENFENDIKPCIIISIDKIGYGYDNDKIDFLCFGDARQSEISIRQIIGRGLRWNKQTYPNKLLHILIPIYKDEFNDHLKTCLDYIISECGCDNILKINLKFNNSNNELLNNGKQYTGDEIPIEILKELCTTGHNMFSKFMIFLKSNNIFDETSYNNLYENNNDWMVKLENIKEKYPKFNFQMIHPNRNLYYKTKDDAVDNYNKCLKNIRNKQILKFKLIDKLIEINKIDNKIPIIIFDLYYL
jgi:superfamily II DNA or RNA helicase